MKFSNKKHTLTFEFDSATKELEIHADIKGLTILKAKIALLINANNSDHTHLMSESWGGEELTNQKQSTQNEIIQSVKIFKWK